MKMMKTMIPMKKPSTPNNQHPTFRGGSGRVHWLLDVSRFPFCLAVLLALLASGTMASAQRNRFGNNGNGNGGGNNGNGFRNNGNGGGNNGNGFRNNGGGNNVPGPTNYAQFSGFIAVRNIFNPARFAIISNQSRPPRPPQAGPAFSLVGTMSYEKGMFAFFDGNNYDLRKVLYASDTNSIAGYTVAEITPAGVQLQSADKKQTLRLKIGDVMRQNGDAWQLAGQGELSTSMGGGVSAAPAATGNTSVPEAGSAPSPAPSPALEGNDTLRKLMQQRQSELTK